MGIESFFGSISDNITLSQENRFLGTINNKIKGNHIFFDSNSILYVTGASLMSLINKILYHLIKPTGSQKINGMIKSLNLEPEIVLKQSPKEFSEYFTPERLDDMMMKKCYQYILNSLEKNYDTSQIKTVYVTFDGVPTKAKMITQRKRRFIGSVMDNLKKNIFEKHKKDLEKDNNRFLYETYKVEWKTVNITPGTKFMKGLSDILSSPFFVNEMKKLCPNLVDYSFNGPMTPGEGEYKIVNRARSKKFLEMKKDGEYSVFYSPDSDAVLLCLLLGTSVSMGYSKDPELNTKITNMLVLRQNQQKSTYETINTDILSSNIYKYVQQFNKNCIAMNKDNVIADIVLLLSVFGNDFIPKIESLNVREHFNVIIDIYSRVLLENNCTHVISFDEKRKKRMLNIEIFKKILSLLKEKEGKYLQMTFIKHNYHNYKNLRKTIKATEDNFIIELNKILSMIRELNDEIRKEKSIKKWEENETFVQILQKLLRWKNIPKNEVVKKYKEYYFSNGKFPKMDIALQKYASTSNNSYHSQNIEKKLNNIDPSLRILDYDREMYQLDRMLDSYVKKFNAEKINLGSFSVDENKLVVKATKIETTVNEYYVDFFNANLQEKNKITDICSQYFSALMWVFEYYFNNYDEKYHYENGNTYFYEKKRSPLLTQLSEYVDKLNQKEVDKICSFVSIESNIKRENYFTPLEQLLYVTPENILKNIIQKEFIPFIESYPFYMKIKDVSDKIWANSPEVPNIIDCRGAMFVSTCHLEIVYEKISKKEDERFLKEVRKIKLSPENKILNEFIKYDKIFSTKHYSSGGEKKNEFNVFFIHASSELKKFFKKAKTADADEMIKKINILLK